ncbi:DUF3108 domain-containing protein [Solilutibacter silvestris]|uniref:DUF3108 domain-containing protein n=1 Tax=Solilutibacter silvestris TaxID=1645665 RepID=A0A2K1Q314_9GAMM|nr:DUF3108 domain-containing protein [Lysobacter silvestris]PNS09381.1 hypothetical protein Lysil_1010 [Lysobacter silvestris]
MKPILTTLLATGLFAASLSAHAALKPFNATYQASYMGMAGAGKMSLVSQGGNEWKYSMSITASVGSAKQSTTFEDVGGNWRPLSGQDATNVLFKSDLRNANYDWGKREATWSGKVKPDRRGPVALQAGDVDAMLMNLAVVRDVEAGKPLHYRLVDNGKAKSVSFTIAGKETLTIAGKQVQATKVTGEDLVLWVATGYPVPVRIHKNQDNIDLKLQSID